MDEQRIWAPWRIGYIAGDRDEQPEILEPAVWQPSAEHDCFMCRAAADYADAASARRQNMVLAVDDHSVTLLNRYPYNNGHLLVCPRRHVGDLAELSDAEHLAAMHALAHYSRKLAGLIRADGFNIGLNLGRVAGAGRPGHLHWHLVPRWNGDSNFMPVTGGTRVISQSLDALWEAVVGKEE